MEKLLEVSDLHVAFPSKRETVRAVDGVSFQVFQGETFGLVGESGCGKSQTLRSILGLLKQPGRITGGEIRYKGADIAKMSQRELQKIRGKEIGGPLNCSSWWASPPLRPVWMSIPTSSPAACASAP